MNVRNAGLLAAGALLAVAAAPVRAQADAAGYPSKPVRIIVGFAPGSSTDVTARIFALKLAEMWGVGVTVENTPGAGGTVGAARAAKAAPDGYTLQYGANGAMTIAPSLFTKLQYDAVRDFAPVSQVLLMGSILAVHNSLPVKSMKELLALARARPGELSYASPGTGTPQHIGFELLKILAHVDITHVPYKGAIFTDVLGGRVPITLQNFGAILPTIRDGKLRAIAQSSLKRSPSMPDLPTIAESGFPGFEAVSWFSFLVPTGTPAPIVKKVHQDVLRVLGQADARGRFTELGLDIVGNSPAELAAIIKQDIAKWGKVIRDAGITATN
ncbi:MAG: tripartite tricarboxylate transporter substrate binding protein [Burkholderiales bacterium]|nr:tripartite tricarboxylate transporter substrate binding protein [Burkholderiales bacterium]